MNFFIIHRQKDNTNIALAIFRSLRMKVRMIVQVRARVRLKVKVQVSAIFTSHLIDKSSNTTSVEATVV